jgi:hypothetical protein
MLHEGVMSPYPHAIDHYPLMIKVITLILVFCIIVRVLKGVISKRMGLL